MFSTNPGTTPRRVHRSTRLAGAVAAVVLALTLAACGSSEPDPVDLAAEAAGEVDVVQVLKEAEESMGTAEALSEDELREKYDEWIASKTRSGTESSGIDQTAGPLTVGDCTDHLPTGAEDTAAEIASVDCDGDHLTEVYLSMPMAELGTDSPSDADIVDAALDGCEAGFDEYVGIPWLESQNTFQFIAPSAGSFQDGDRTALCYAYPLSFAPFSGTLQGSKS